MVDIINQVVTLITNTKTAFLLCIIMILADLFSGYIKAFKTKTYNSSINRDGLAKKMMWFLMLMLGVAVQLIANTNLLVIAITGTCIITEFMSIIENCHEIGIDFNISKVLDNYK